MTEYKTYLTINHPQFHQLPSTRNIDLQKMSIKRKFVTLEETVISGDLPSNIVVKGGDDLETSLRIKHGMTVSSMKTWCVDWVGKPISHLLFYLVKEGQEDNKDDFPVDDLKITCNDYI